MALNSPENASDTCPSNLKAWLDCELEAEESRFVAEHVAACDRCRAQADTLRSIAEELHALTHVSTPEIPVARIVAAAGNEEREEAAIIRTLKRVAAVAAVVLVSAIGILVWPGDVGAGDYAMTDSGSDPALFLVISDAPLEEEY